MDLTIRNGTIITATETYQADIGIEVGVIALIGRDPQRAATQKARMDGP